MQDGWEPLFWLVFRRSRDPIVLLDERRHILELNEPARAVFGRTRGELLGTSIAESFPSQERALAERDWQRILRSGELIGSRVVQRPDGSSVEVEWAARRGQIGGRRMVIAVWVSENRLGHRANVGDCEQPLTRREREVVTLITLGHDTREIAAQLQISPETVKSHIRNAMSKLCAHTRAQLVAVALSSGQIAPVSDMAADASPV